MEEFKILYTKGSGPGGQHKNKVETCVTIIHLPTGLKERCQDTRSKLRNYNLALDRLEQRLLKLEQKAKHIEQNKFRKEQILNTKRIRTYNFARDEVIDHRTNKKASLTKILNGNLDLLK